MRLEINNSKCATKEVYAALLNAITTDPEVADQDIPEVIAQMWDLGEYVDDFLKDVNCKMTCNIMFDARHGSEINIYVWRSTHHGFAFDLSFDELRTYNIPRLGDAIYHMWNAYVDVFMGMHGTYVPPIPEKYSEVETTFKQYKDAVKEAFTDEVEADE